MSRGVEEVAGVVEKIKVDRRGGPLRPPLVCVFITLYENNQVYDYLKRSSNVTTIFVSMFTLVLVFTVKNAANTAQADCV